LELRLTENIDQPDEHAYNEQPSLGSISTPRTQSHSDSRELAVPGQ
jgi:hypothetical protein